jgi:hypothetical protein
MLFVRRVMSSAPVSGDVRDFFADEKLEEKRKEQVCRGELLLFQRYALVSSSDEPRLRF